MSTTPPSLAFTPYCCSCMTEIYPNNGGLVLSCGDFICAACERTFHPQSSCPGCSKKGVRSLRLQGELPAQVIQNMTDVSKQLEIVNNTLVFQIKHYKVSVKRGIELSTSSNKSTTIDNNMTFFDRSNEPTFRTNGHATSDQPPPSKQQRIDREPPQRSQSRGSVAPPPSIQQQQPIKSTRPLPASYKELRPDTNETIQSSRSSVFSFQGLQSNRESTSQSTPSASQAMISQPIATAPHPTSTNVNSISLWNKNNEPLHDKPGNKPEAIDKRNMNQLIASSQADHHSAANLGLPPRDRSETSHPKLASTPLASPPPSQILAARARPEKHAISPLLQAPKPFSPASRKIQSASSAEKPLTPTRIRSPHRPVLRTPNRLIVSMSQQDMQNQSQHGSKMTMFTTPGVHN